MEYASNGKGNLGVALGAIGTGLNLLNNGSGFLTGALGNGYVTPCQQQFVTKDEMKMVSELASKDSQIAILTAENDSEKKMIEVYKQSHSELSRLRDDVKVDIKELRDAMVIADKEQAVINAKFSDAIGVNTSNISDIKSTLNEITQIKIPNHAVCPGWGNVTVTPVNGSWPIGTTIA